MVRPAPRSDGCVLGRGRNCTEPKAAGVADAQKDPTVAFAHAEAQTLRNNHRPQGFPVPLTYLPCSPAAIPVADQPRCPSPCKITWFFPWFLLCLQPVPGLSSHHSRWGVLQPCPLPPPAAALLLLSRCSQAFVLGNTFLSDNCFSDC